MLAVRSTPVLAFQDAWGGSQVNAPLGMRTGVWATKHNGELKSRQFSGLDEYGIVWIILMNNQYLIKSIREISGRNSCSAFNRRRTILPEME